MYSTTTVAPGSAHAGSLASDTTNEASPAAKPTAAPGGGSTAATGAAGGDIAYQLIGRLPNPKERESVLAELSRRREDHPDLAVVLWNSCGTSAILVQEIVAAYAWLHPPLLTMTASNRICNALALLQLVATHAETRARFLRSSIPQLLYPLLATTHKSRPFDNLRLTSLGVIGAIVKHDSPEVVQYLIQTEFIPLCLKILEIGTELCKIVAIFVFQRIINDPTGLTYMVDHPTRLLTMLAVLAVIIEQLLKFKSPRLLKSVIRLYIRLAEHPDVLTYLRENLPTELRDATFLSMLEEEPSAKKSLVQLLTKLYGSEVATVATTTGLSNVNLANPHHQHLHQQQQQQLHQQALQPPPGITTA
ncbi:Rcd1-domain-containing protein [Ramicandelaber brevisporus]|nr:Rcd1-domain-containing protein [Ramicandelaber brevisporus]